MRPLLEISLKGEKACLKTLQCLDQRFQQSMEELDEHFPDAYDALRLIILARRVQICECFMKELGKTALEKQHHQLLNALNATSAFVSARNSSK